MINATIHAAEPIFAPRRYLESVVGDSWITYTMMDDQTIHFTADNRAYEVCHTSTNIDVASS